MPSTGGNNVGLGECAIGFDQPIPVTTYWAPTTTGGFGVATFGPNLDENPLYPVYASCAEQLVPCEDMSELWFEVLATESAPIGAVKALYRD